MHTFRNVTDPDELERLLAPVLEKNGGTLPPRGCYMAAIEFDDNGQVFAYQMLQNAVFLEGLWAREKSASLLRLYHMAQEFAEEKLGTQRLMTFTRRDEVGQKIGRIANKLGLEPLNWDVYRRIKKCHSQQ